ncbi:kinase-like domain-containing protein [Rhizophagus clarus]|uniref:Kinase-like domain-containing protein n=1 Tax=Rhizophagus clarus TaxID=94130 RepID=A0A8H3R9J8_9GLOM|nr:kinase-like domain-containing protein [Rhizophagus clarus]
MELEQMKIIIKHLIHLLIHQEINHIFAQYFVGECYEYEYGTIKDEESIEKDLEKASYWYEKAVNNGHLIAMHNLGLNYIDGEVDKQKAFELYQELANLGRMVAQESLGTMYVNGDWITKVIDKAIYWYEKSAKQDIKTQ